MRAHLPEPLYLFAATSVVTIDSVLLPLICIYLLHTTKHQLDRDDSIMSVWVKKLVPQVLSHQIFVSTPEGRPH